DAIKDMRALLGQVVVKLIPPEATLVVDGQEILAGAAKEPLQLGPGEHKIVARADGFVTGEQSGTVASGKSQDVTIVLARETGQVTVEAPDPRLTIIIDQHAVGAGTWTGMLLLGAHTVEIAGPGVPPYRTEISVVAGKPLLVRPTPPKNEEPAQRRG